MIYRTLNVKEIWEDFFSAIIYNNFDQISRVEMNVLPYLKQGKSLASASVNMLQYWGRGKAC